ncbi:Uma2 family endonuclease [Microcoleus sp. S13_C5]|uniref:Uma2 family endonuclease n=1 Tax=Microcoleus sp. S13_C5 TaxID=3055411 RepID=UPI002FD16E84
MVQIQQTKTLNLSEFLKLPETEPASEYINGQIIQKPMPQGKHSRIQCELVSAINVAVKSKKIALAFPELRCTFGSRSIVPDVTVFTWERIPVDENGDVANVFETYPDWTIEILSPGQSQTKVTGNILHCLKNGTKMGWLIDPMVRSVLIYPPGQQPEILAKPEELLPVPDWAAELRLTVGDLFGWLKL